MNSPLPRLRLFFICGAALLGLLGTVSRAFGVGLTTTTDQEGDVSIGSYNAQGQIVRSLVTGSHRLAGTETGTGARRGVTFTVAPLLSSSSKRIL